LLVAANPSNSDFTDPSQHSVVDFPMQRFLILVLFPALAALPAAELGAMADQALILTQPGGDSAACLTPSAPTVAADTGTELVLRADPTDCRPVPTNCQRLINALPAPSELTQTHLSDAARATASGSSSFQLVTPPHFRQQASWHLSSDWRSWATLGAGYTRLF
jgi:hypothetical protein